MDCKLQVGNLTAESLRISCLYYYANERYIKLHGSYFTHSKFDE